MAALNFTSPQKRITWVIPRLRVYSVRVYTAKVLHPQVCVIRVCAAAFRIHKFILSGIIMWSFTFPNYYEVTISS